MWYAVCGAKDADKDLEIWSSSPCWTLSEDSNEAGWCSDKGTDGYGLTYADARLLADAANAAIARTTPPIALHHIDDWHEDDGPVLWHRIDEWGGLCEAPVVARGDQELDDMQPWPLYYSYWSRLPAMPRFPLRSLMIAPPGALICDWAL